MASSPTSLQPADDFCYAAFTPNNNAPGPREIQCIEEELKNFDFILQFFQRHRTACSAVLSPIRRIPPEVLGEIFTFAVCPGGIMTNQGREHLLAICLVSKGWRDAAYGTHQLWTCLQFERLFTEDARLKAERWLEKAGSLPKSVSVRAADIRLGLCLWGNAQCSLVNPAMARFLTNGPAITELAIECASSNCVHHLLQEMKNIKHPDEIWSWSSVRVLRLVVDSEWLEEIGETISDSEVTRDVDEGRRITTLFAQLPALTSLYLHLPQYEGDDTDLALDIPFELLSRLDDFTLVCDWGADKILPVLKCCINVETFILDVEGAEFVLEPDDPWHANKDDRASLLPKVRSLSLRNLPPDGASYLQFFRTYALEEMEIWFTSEGIHWHSTWGISFSSYFERFIQRSKGKATSLGLRRLQLSSLEITSKEMQRILQKLPSLTHLTMDEVWVPSTLFLLDLTKVKRGVAPLPNLEELKLFQIPNNFDADHVREYIKARQRLLREDGTPFARTKFTVDRPAGGIQARGNFDVLFGTGDEYSSTWDTDEEFGEESG